MSNEAYGVHQTGNAIRLECGFSDFDGSAVDPQLVKVVIYNAKYEALFTKVISDVNKKSVGEYFFDYVTENAGQKYFYEWYGEIDGTPSLKRGQFATKFI